MGIRKRQVAIAVAVVIGALGYIVFAGMREGMVYYYTVSELQALQDQVARQPLRVAGKVVPGSIVQTEGNLVHRFVIADGDQRLPVVYRGLAPDTFVDDAEAVVEGQLGEDGVFRATFLMAKCPSKYEAETDYSKYRREGIAAPALDR